MLEADRRAYEIGSEVSVVIWLATSLVPACLASPVRPGVGIITFCRRPQLGTRRLPRAASKGRVRSRFTSKAFFVHAAILSIVVHSTADRVTDNVFWCAACCRRGSSPSSALRFLPILLASPSGVCRIMPFMARPAPSSGCWRKHCILASAWPASSGASASRASSETLRAAAILPGLVGLNAADWLASGADRNRVNARLIDFGERATMKSTVFCRVVQRSRQ